MSSIAYQWASQTYLPINVFFFLEQRISAYSQHRPWSAAADF